MSDLKEEVIKEIKKIYDPEIPVNIYELGLIYKIEIIDIDNGTHHCLNSTPLLPTPMTTGLP